MNRERISKGLLAGVQGLALAVTGLAGGIALFVLSVLSLAFILLGVGVFTTPVVLGVVRWFAGWHRTLAAEWAGVEVPAPYRPWPPDLRTGITGQVERCSLLVRDPATWRDLQWLLVNTTAGVVVAILPPGLLAEGVYGSVLAAGVWRPLADGGSFPYTFIQVSSQGTAFLAAGFGLVLVALSLRFGPLLVLGHARLTRSLLAPTRRMALTQRVERLTESRHDAVDSSAAELRRIERDLHDGAQARLVAMGMSLGTVEALIEKDPEQAKKLLAQARSNSAEALTELRDLVRGIHPPVLAERGLGDAVQALALRMAVPVEVSVRLPGRFAEPVESAAYFAVSEALTNAAKHSGAERIWLDIDYDTGDGALRIAVTDDGRGGADVSKGSGMAGIERRLGQFDGIMAVNSPEGGPTMVTMEIPCDQRA